MGQPSQEVRGVVERYRRMKGGAVQRELVAVWVGRVKSPAQSPQRGRRQEWDGSAPTPGRDTRKSSHRTMDISWLIPRIAVGGGIWTPENMAKVAGEGITHIIDMQVECDDRKLGPEEHGIEVLWNPTDDDFELKAPDLFRRGVEFALDALKRPDAKVFIHCAAGVHRAPMMALAVLGSMGWDLEDARALIERQRPVADFAEVYVESVKRFLDRSGEQHWFLSGRDDRDR